MKKQILRLCKHLNKFTLDEITTISELESEEIKPYLDLLLKENNLIYKNNIYYYKKVEMQQNNKLPLKFQFHTKEDIDYMIKGFCADIEAKKMMSVFNFSKHVINVFYQYFRTSIYETQKQELLKYFEENPKLPQEREYMNTKVYLYLYDDKLFVSEKALKTQSNKKHTEQERLTIKNIYLRSYRKVLSRSFEQKFHLHLSEELWKYGKEFNIQYKKLNQILFS